MSLFKDPEEDGTSDDGTNESDKKPAVKWHKVILVSNFYEFFHVDNLGI